MKKTEAIQLQKNALHQEIRIWQLCKSLRIQKSDSSSCLALYSQKLPALRQNTSHLYSTDY